MRAFGQETVPSRTQRFHPRHRIDKTLRSPNTFPRILLVNVFQQVVIDLDRFCRLIVKDIVLSQVAFEAIGVRFQLNSTFGIFDCAFHVFVGQMQIAAKQNGFDGLGIQLNCPIRLFNRIIHFLLQRQRARKQNDGGNILFVNFEDFLNRLFNVFPFFTIEKNPGFQIVSPNLFRLKLDRFFGITNGGFADIEQHLLHLIFVQHPVLCFHRSRLFA